MSVADDFSQLEMAHRLPGATLVDRFEFLSGLGAGRRRVVRRDGRVRTSRPGGRGCTTPLRDAHDSWASMSMPSASSTRPRLRHAVTARRHGGEDLGSDAGRRRDRREVIEHLDDPGAFLDGMHAHRTTGLRSPRPTTGLVNALAPLANYR